MTGAPTERRLRWHLNIPNVVVLAGTGELYWTGGMIMADEAAMAGRPDHLLWLNDDVELADGTITMLIDVGARDGNEAIVVGTTVDPDSREATYGGYRRLGVRSISNWWNRMESCSA